MSWYSDGERFEEQDLPICKNCNRGFTQKECAKCKNEFFSEIEEDTED